MRHRDPTDIGADNIDRAMREIDQAADAENQRQPHRDQRIDVADDQAVDGVVEPGPHPRQLPLLPSQTWKRPSLTTSSTFFAPRMRRVPISKDALPKITLGTSRQLTQRVTDRAAIGSAVADRGHREIDGIERIGVEGVRFDAAVFCLEAADELPHLGPRIVREIARACVHALDRVAAELDEAR